jgi:hypothetical protein
MGFLAMNRFKVVNGQEGPFEAVWLGRQTSLPTLPGFIEFTLLKGLEEEDHVLYATHTMWRTHDDFVGWTKSDAFRNSHARADSTAHLYLGHPNFEGFNVIQSVDASGVIVRSGEASQPDLPARDKLMTRLGQNPDGVLESLAREHGVTLLDATRMLPPANVRWTAASNFEPVMAELATWGEVLFLVHTPSIVLEVKGAIPPGARGKGYFNLHGESPIGGHLKADSCVGIAFVRRPFMGMDSASIQFFDDTGGAMFKVFVARTPDKKLDTAQLVKFETLANRFASASNAA